MLSHQLKELIEIENQKNILLSEIITWLKAKNLWEECQQCCTVKVETDKQIIYE